MSGAGSGSEVKFAHILCGAIIMLMGDDEVTEGVGMIGFTTQSYGFRYRLPQRGIRHC
jgi:hypothetical protein